MNCRLCNGSSLKFFYSMGSYNQYKYYKCNNCSLVNLDLSNGYNQEKYTGGYFDVHKLDHKRNINQTQSFGFIFKNLKNVNSIFDIGCGNGRLLYLAKQNGWRVNGLELSQEFADRIKKDLEIDVYVGDFLEIDLESEKNFDVVTLRHVLEHLPDPILAMTKMNKLLKLNGFAVLELPNISGLDLRIKRTLNKIGLAKKKYLKDFIPGHVNEYCRKSFKYLVEKTGFKFTKWETYSSKGITNIIYNKIPIGNKVRTIIQKVENITS